jgi:hypothetical protein
MISRDRLTRSALVGLALSAFQVPEAHPGIGVESELKIPVMFDNDRQCLELRVRMTSAADRTFISELYQDNRWVSPTEANPNLINKAESYIAEHPEALQNGGGECPARTRLTS